MEDNKYDIDDVVTLSKIRTRSKRLATDLTSFALKFEDVSSRADDMLARELDELKLDVTEVKSLLTEFCEELDKVSSNVEVEYRLTFDDLLKKS